MDARTSAPHPWPRKKWGDRLLVEVCARLNADGAAMSSMLFCDRDAAGRDSEVTPDRARESLSQAIEHNLPFVGPTRVSDRIRVEVASWMSSPGATQPCLRATFFKLPAPPGNLAFFSLPKVRVNNIRHAVRPEVYHRDMISLHPDRAWSPAPSEDQCTATVGAVPYGTVLPSEGGAVEYKEVMLMAKAATPESVFADLQVMEKHTDNIAALLALPGCPRAGACQWTAMYFGVVDKSRRAVGFPLAPDAAAPADAVRGMARRLPSQLQAELLPLLFPPLPTNSRLGVELLTLTCEHDWFSHPREDAVALMRYSTFTQQMRREWEELERDCVHGAGPYVHFVRLNSLSEKPLDLVAAVRPSLVPDATPWDGCADLASADWWDSAPAVAVIASRGALEEEFEVEPLPRVVVKLQLPAQGRIVEVRARHAPAFDPANGMVRWLHPMDCWWRLRGPANCISPTALAMLHSPSVVRQAVLVGIPAHPVPSLLAYCRLQVVPALQPKWSVVLEPVVDTVLRRRRNAQYAVVIVVLGQQHCEPAAVDDFAASVARLVRHNPELLGKLGWILCGTYAEPLLHAARRMQAEAKCLVHSIMPVDGLNAPRMLREYVPRQWADVAALEHVLRTSHPWMTLVVDLSTTRPLSTHQVHARQWIMERTELSWEVVASGIVGCRPLVQHVIAGVRDAMRTSAHSQRAQIVSLVKVLRKSGATAVLLQAAWQLRQESVVLHVVRSPDPGEEQREFARCLADAAAAALPLGVVVIADEAHADAVQEALQLWPRSTAEAPEAASPAAASSAAASASSAAASASSAAAAAASTAAVAAASSSAAHAAAATVLRHGGVVLLCVVDRTRCSWLGGDASDPMHSLANSFHVDPFVHTPEDFEAVAGGLRRCATAEEFNDVVVAIEHYKTSVVGFQGDDPCLHHVAFLAMAALRQVHQNLLAVVSVLLQRPAMHFLIQPLRVLAFLSLFGNRVRGLTLGSDRMPELDQLLHMDSLPDLQVLVALDVAADQQTEQVAIPHVMLAALVLRDDLDAEEGRCPWARTRGQAPISERCTQGIVRVAQEVLDYFAIGPPDLYIALVVDLFITRPSGHHFSPVVQVLLQSAVCVRDKEKRRVRMRLLTDMLAAAVATGSRHGVGDESLRRLERHLHMVVSRCYRLVSERVHDPDYAVAALQWAW